MHFMLPVERGGWRGRGNNPIHAEHGGQLVTYELIGQKVRGKRRE